MTLTFNPLSLLRAAALASLTLTAVSCVSGPPYQPDGNVFITDKPPRYGYQGTNSPEDGPRNNQGQTKPRNSQGEDPAKLHDPNTNNKPAEPTVSNTPSEPGPASNPSNDPSSTPVEPKAKPNPSASLPFGTPVIGKKGFVYSPYAPDKGMVDVTDIPSGTKVECPYTGKHFRVP